MSIFNEIRVQEAIQRAVAKNLAAGISVYYGQGDEIVRENPDGRRFIVRLVGDNFETVRELVGGD